MLALLFPGQGSQEVGMGRDAFEASAAARAVFESADDALGFSLTKLIFEGPDDELRRTEVQQPAILTTSIALLRALEERVPVDPDFVAGHSLGEYTALVAAGALPFEEAVPLVHSRGRYMQEAVPEGLGSMAAIMGGSLEGIREACEFASGKLDQVVAPANLNSSRQIVIAGHKEAVELACEKALELGAKRAVPLAVSAPFHCSLMESAAAKLALDLDGVHFSDASPPVISNVEATPNASADRIPGLLRSQVTSPVRFTDMVARLSELGVDRYLEVGPGRVLTGLVARIERRASRANVTSMEDLEEASEFMALKVSAG